MKNLWAFLLLTSTFDSLASGLETIQDIYSTRHLAVSSCNAGSVNFYLILTIDDKKNAKHSVLAFDRIDSIVAWQEFGFSGEKIYIIESSGGTTMTDLLSEWRDFLIKTPLEHHYGINWIDHPVSRKCPPNSENPWDEEKNK